MNRFDLEIKLANQNNEAKQRKEFFQRNFISHRGKSYSKSYFK